MEFFDRVQRCTGNVYRLDGDGQKKDLKELAGYLICSGMPDNPKRHTGNQWYPR